MLEVSNGTIEMTEERKCEYIARLCGEFRIFGEVGFKDSERSHTFSPSKWIECIKAELAAGADKVITEARESGSSGICRPNGELRQGLIEEIAEAGIEMERLIFEAPNKSLQTYFIKRFGPNVNVANVAAHDVVALETLRLGLRSDTLMAFEG
jgi:phosphosulfolactate synthase